MMELPTFDIDQFDNASNVVTNKFHGKVKVSNGTALYRYNKNARIQRLMHKIKYKEGQNIGMYLGRIFGNSVHQLSWSQDIDMIIPVPLHPKKLRIRGFNQAEKIAVGLSETMYKPINIEILQRSIFTETQTRKSRIQRWKNVQDVFEVREDKILELQGKHVLFLDDIITTGATMESGIKALLEAGASEVSVATLALAE